MVVDQSSKCENPLSWRLTFPRSNQNVVLVKLLRNVLSWLIKTKAPRQLFNFFSNHSIVTISKWFVGSSRSKISVSLISARAMAALLRSPPDMVIVSAAPSSPISAKIMSAWKWSSSELCTSPLITYS